MENLWNDNDAADYANDAKTAGQPEALGLRVYTSRIIGKVADLVLHGGGNTSVKVTDNDGNAIMHVKGSGWDLETIESPGLPAVKLAPLHAARKEKKLSDPEMVALLRSNLLDPSAPNPSVEALLHAYLPFDFVDHTHSTAVLALANQDKSEDIMREIYGDRLAFLPYVMPGYDLSIAGADLFDRFPTCEGLWLKNHGLFTFGTTAKQSYDRMIDFVTDAENYLTAKGIALPGPETSDRDLDPAIVDKLSTALGADGSPFADAMAMDFRSTPSIRKYLSNDALETIAVRGTATPDHVIRIKPFPLIIGADASLDDITSALEDYKARYRAYFERNAPNASEEKVMLDAWPRMVLIKSLGLVGLGANDKAARIAGDLGEQTARIINAAEDVGTFQPIHEADLFDMEYWSLEQAKLQKK
ncbi:class II aldolase/adducin family protein [Thalassospira lucentensis]|uniref:Short-chain dehydrogenase n=1 Tax=Thalassospira lucentensis TaxID=168935 RepID=A0A358HMT1_9PROT|nr:class II aldolase/adducin family protein [Thalassospira lucentensis]HBU96481.1 short-chain dehydrogenase [Thalassospira lucentensis]HCW65830.1 short-chain dehydrogenase [Thalassospira lucentensis]|tara:strand:+ start:664 stop:1911 length:1248 start_codon:yes stop_codon:yes gene_type:complete